MTEKTETRKKQAGGLGLAGRVVALACMVAVVASIAQWVVVPFLMRGELNYQRDTAITAAVSVLAENASTGVFGGATPTERAQIVESFAVALPEGVATIFDKQGRVLAHAPADAPRPVLDLNSPALSRMVVADGRFSRMQPVLRGGEVVGYAHYSFGPRSLVNILKPVLWRYSLVLLLALMILGPLSLPVARKVLQPVTDLEARIRARTASDTSRLSTEADDKLLKPLLEAIDEAQARADKATRRALQIAFADPLTGLPNRARFVSRLEAVVDKSPGRRINLMVVDIDGFRRLNVTLGPAAADALLSRIADRLRQAATHFPGADVFLARLGADQFGLLATDIDDPAAKALAAHASRLVGEPLKIENQTLRVTVSVGASSIPGVAVSAGDLIKQAEIALKEAKRLPQNKRVFFDARLMERARDQSRLEADLRAAVERNEFVAAYQPKVRFETGELVGAEALARWRRPDGRVVSPGVFIPMAEEMGLVSQIGRSVLRDACRAAAGWAKDGAHATVAVNISPYQFDEPDFVQSIQDALEESGLDPSLLELEITESAAVTDPDRVARIMWPLRNRGVRLAIDDFGTGHSNFAAITRLPFDVFKIDQQFVRALATDPQAPAIVEMILAMAEAMNQETVAEGVETSEQADFLLRRACTYGQGYYFSPPLPADEFNLYMRQRRRSHGRRAA